MGRPTMKSMKDTILVGIVALCITAILVVMLLLHYPTTQITSFVMGLAVQVPVVVALFRHQTNSQQEIKDDTQSIKAQLNGQLDARISAAVASGVSAELDKRGIVPVTPVAATGVDSPPVGAVA